MKTFTFCYDPKATLKGSLDDMMNNARSGRSHVEKNEMRSASLKALLTVATENRLELFRLIHEQRPESVYDLAKFFDRDLSYVSKEVRVLEGLGLIRLKSQNVGGRDRLKPQALYDRIILDFSMTKEHVS